MWLTWLSLHLQCVIGQDVQLVATFKNQGKVLRNVTAHLDCDIIFYTGVVASHFKDITFDVTVLPYQSELHQNLVVLKSEDLVMNVLAFLSVLQAIVCRLRSQLMSTRPS